MGTEQDGDQNGEQENIKKLIPESDPAEGKPEPWWGRIVNAAVITAIVGGAANLTVAKWSNIQKDRELMSQESKQKHDEAMEEMRLKHSIEMDYLDHMKADPERLRTLRLIAGTSDDPRIISWAKEEQEIVEKSIADLEGQIRDKKAEVEETKKKALAAMTDSSLKAAQISQLREDALQQQKELASLRAQRNESKVEFIDNFDFVREFKLKPDVAARMKSSAGLDAPHTQ